MFFVFVGVDLRFEERGVLVLSRGLGCIEVFSGFWIKFWGWEGGEVF